MEKAGIIKAGVPVVTATRDEAFEVIRRTASDRRAPLLHIPASYSWTIGASGMSGQTLDLTGPNRRYDALEIPLAGRHQAENAVTAIAAADLLEAAGFRLSETVIRRGLTQASWPGRLQIVADRPRILLDGAHNPAGAQALSAFVQEHRPTLGRLVLVFGVLKDKDWETMLALLGPLADQIILTHPPADRGADPHDLLLADRYCPKVEIAADPGEGLALARAAAGVDDTILVTGSLYMVAAALRILDVPVP
jgi:dihydrofolate synthase/folylpolyglutamate synthase